MPRQSDQPAARSTYAGLRLTITQHPDADTCTVTLATKQTYQRWDEWSLLFPALRVQAREVTGYEDILRVVVAAVEEVLRVDREYR